MKVGKRWQYQTLNKMKIAGQEKFHTITETYYRGSHAIMFVFDVAFKTPASENVKIGESTP